MPGNADGFPRPCEEVVEDNEDVVEDLAFPAPATNEFKRLDSALPVPVPGDVVLSNSPDRLGDPAAPPGDVTPPPPPGSVGKLIFGIGGKCNCCRSGAWVRAAWSNCSTPACAAARSRSANELAPENMFGWLLCAVWESDWRLGGQVELGEVVVVIS